MYHAALVNSLRLAIENLTSPPVLAFVLGVIAVTLKSDLRLPDPIHTWISTYLLLAIGLKGGHALRDADPGDLALPIALTVVFGVAVPLLVFLVARRGVRLKVQDAGSIAAHYGSVSVVTFTAATLFASEGDFAVEPFMTALVALLEVPGIIVAFVVTSMRGSGVKWKSALHEVLTGRSVLLLAGGLVIGGVASTNTYGRVSPFFEGMFSGLLTLFLLDMGATVATRLRVSRGLPWRLVVFALISPLVLGTAGVLAGTAAGLSVGGAAVFGVMVASASYIAAPAAVRITLPEADTGLSLGAALGVTFPLNLIAGIPLMFVIARAVG